MKALIILFMLSISFLPLAISVRHPHIRLPTKSHLTDGGNSAVLDIDGNPIAVGAKYYAIPAPIGVDGGVSASNSNEGNPSGCPTQVVLNLSIAGQNPPAEGRPIVFYPLAVDTSGGDEAAVRENLPLNVAFHVRGFNDHCAKETVWKLDVQQEQPVIVTGGVIGDRDDISNWFRIAKNYNGRGYVFTFWPSLCSHCLIMNWPIGTVGEYKQLGINDDFPYPFYFVRAD